MSRVVVFDLNNKAVGEFDAQVNRGWMVYGNPGVDGGGQTTIDIPDSVAEQKWMQLGCMVLVQNPPLPAWAGVIDTPWQATSPVQVTVYNSEYLFKLRAPESSTTLTGSVSGILSQIIAAMNTQEPLYLSLGRITDDRITRAHPIDQRTYWDQVIPLLENSGHEMILRPARDASNRLVIFADVGVNLGDDTGFLLDDGGPGKNMSVTDARVDGKIINRVRGVSGDSTADDQLQTEVIEDQASQDVYRTRSEIEQFRDITEQTTLENYTRTVLAVNKAPYIELAIEIQNKGDAFLNVKPGNRVIVHAHDVRLPGGAKGWRGTGRILVPVYDETKDVILAKVRGPL